MQLAYINFQVPQWSCGITDQYLHSASLMFIVS